MTETVWIVTNPSGGRQGRMHTDRDCSRLKRATKTVLEKEKSAVESHRSMCKWCAEDIELGKGHPNKYQNLLLDMDPDEVGT